MNTFTLPFNVSPSSIRISHSSKILFVGSCFSDEISKLATLHGLNAESNPFGTIFHPIPIADNLLYSINSNTTEDEIFQSSDVFLSTFLSSKIFASSKELLFEKIFQLRKNILMGLKELDVLFITFGTAWGYHLKENNKIVANCHKLPQEQFTKNLSEIKYVYDVWAELLKLLKSEFPRLKVVFTISPVRHSKDGLIENNKSKSRLFELVHLLCENYNSEYFPSYEIIIDELRDYRFYKKDRVHPSEEAVAYVWDKFMNCFLSENSIELCSKVLKVKQGLSHSPIHPDSIQSKKHKLKVLSDLNKLSEEHPTINWK